MDTILPMNLDSVTAPLNEDERHTAATALESGQVIYLPQLPFALALEERSFLAPEFADPKAKNISFNPNNGKLKGVVGNPATQQIFQAMLQRYAKWSHTLVTNLFPHYQLALEIGRTSLRPVEIKDRPSSYRKDDTRLHVDAFPSTPNQGRRILRVFCNVNPDGKARVWRLGEPFPTVAKQFLPRLRPPIRGSATLLKLAKLTKGYRTTYDHYMLQLHDNMKADMQYQQNAAQTEMLFLPGTTWLVFTDSVSHAAMSGQHLLEQTFYLPVSAMQYPQQSPLRVLEKLFNQPLI
ncbi:MAG: Kdo hydroxylase family protein [Coxiellaceae bacterium]|nr:MAG: Kdo hydroxylase family protein [Coxiellaceae bacterium]